MEPLRRTLGLWSSVALVVGITIGLGIFRSPAAVARAMPHPLAMLGVWMAGGAITLAGALSLAELAAAIPQSGGFYAYLREGWGRPMGFLFGWAELVLIRASAVGGIALVFGEYALRTAGVDPATHPAFARTIPAAGIAFAAAANIAGVSLGALIVNLSTAAKFSALAVLVTAALTIGGNRGASVGHLTAGAAGPVAAAGLGVALVSVLWAYDGFGDLSFVAGEVKDPQRTLPRAIIIGTGAIVTIYLLTNVAYLYVSPIETVAQSPLVAADTMRVLFGARGVTLVSLFVMVSTFSALNAVMLASPRVFYAMADDGLLFEAIGRYTPRFGTPYVAIAVAALLGAALVGSRSFEAVTNTFVLAVWPFYALSVAAIYRLRRLRPDLPRPYRVVGYPWVPALFIASVAWFVVDALIRDPISTGATLALILAGIPVYYAVFARRAR